MNENKYGQLLNQDIKLHRQWFKEMTKLIGINVQYRSPRPGKAWTTYAEIESNYNLPITVPCIFNQHIDQRTMKKIGWVAELNTEEALISVPYDLKDLQVGCIFIIPSGIDTGDGRLYRVTKLTNIMIYPASITCAMVPEYEDTYDKSLMDHQADSFNLLKEEEDNL